MANHTSTLNQDDQELPDGGSAAGANLDDFDSCAADYLLNELTPADKSAYEAKLIRSNTAKRSFIDMEDAFARLYLLSNEKAAPEACWQTIHQAIKQPEARSARTHTTSYAASSVSNTSKQLNKWLPWLLGSNALLAAGLVAVVVAPGLISTGPAAINPSLPASGFISVVNSKPMPYTAILQSRNAEPMWLVQANADMTELVIDNTKAISFDTDHSQETCILWMDTGKRIVPIGSVPVDGGRITIDVTAEIQSILASGGKMMITREPMPKNTDNMPTAPTGLLESTGKFINPSDIL